MRKKIFVSGRFNVLHSGHFRLFNFAKSMAEALVVGVFAEDQIQGVKLASLEDRVGALRRINLVDEVVVIDRGVEATLEAVGPDLVLKGREFVTLDNPEERWCKQSGAELIFSSGEWHDPVGDVTCVEPDSASLLNIEFVTEYLHRNAISVESIVDAIKKMSGMTVITLGDVIVDEYLLCEPLGMSQEEPAIILKPYEEEVFLGGAAIVAKNIKSLGGCSDLFSIVGDDALGEWVENSMSEIDVNGTLVRSSERRTTQKTRYRVRGASSSYSLFRVSRLSEHEISRGLQDQLFMKIMEALDNADALIFSDFNYGLLPDRLLNRVIKEAKSRQIMMSADSQTSSQVGDICRYKSVDLVFATEHEARISLKNKDDGLIVLSDQLASATGANSVFLKLGAEGALLHSNQSGTSAGRYSTDRLAALNQKPIDVSGAGDAMLAAATLAMVACGDIRISFLVGSLASAIQVSRTGNPGISRADLLEIADRL